LRLTLVVEFDGPPTVVWGVVASIELSKLSSETFNVTRQAVLIAGLANLTGLDPSELQGVGAGRLGEVVQLMDLHILPGPAAPTGRARLGSPTLRCHPPV